MDAFQAYTRHVNPPLGRFLEMSGRDLRLVRARAGTLEDLEGRRFDDWISGFGSFNLGHNPEALKATIREHLDRDAPNLFVENLNPYAGELAAALVRAAGPGFGTCFFSNSGAEAVEAALKTAMLATGRTRIAFAAGAYHGTTLGALACMGRGPYRAPFNAVLADFPEVAFGDAAALEKALLAGDVAAFIVEPIQMEAGVRIASTEYLAIARELCRRHGALLIFDEVQTGMGRTGRLFAYEHAGVEPDILVLAKSLGGGLLPIGAAVLADDLWNRAYGSYLKAEIHNCTFGGNALACRVALKTLELIGAPSFLAAVRRRGSELFTALESTLAGCRVVERVSWRGLVGGIKLRDVDHPWLDWENLGLTELVGYPTSGPLLVERLARHGILAQVCAHDWSVLRVEPPLTVDADACARFIAAIDHSVRWLAANDG
jgi:acetylornithine/succinyldiaminopimelate/putrescine aminotransferase